MLTTTVAGAFVLGVVVIVSIWHFIVAKLAGVYVKVFSIGFGRKLLRRKHGETVYALSLLPFGGYVKFAGESELADPAAEPQPDTPRGPLDEVPDSEIPRARYYTTQPKRIRAAVLVAGPFMNYVLAIVLYIGVFLFQGVVVVPTTRVGDVLADGPAQEAGIAPGDTILAGERGSVVHWSDIEDRSRRPQG
jgi:regulator of sigma E protease